MNRKLIVFLFCTCFSFTSWGLKADFKVGVVDMKTVMSSLNTVKKLEEKFQAEGRKLEEGLLKKRKDIDGLRKKLDNESALLKPKTKKERQGELDKKEMAFQKEVQDVQEKMRKMQRDLLKPIGDNLYTIVAEIVEKEKLSMVVEKMENPEDESKAKKDKRPIYGGGILYLKDEKDITKDVIALYNKKFQAKK